MHAAAHVTRPLPPPSYAQPGKLDCVKRNSYELRCTRGVSLIMSATVPFQLTCFPPISARGPPLPGSTQPASRKTDPILTVTAL